LYLFSILEIYIIYYYFDVFISNFIKINGNSAEKIKICFNIIKSDGWSNLINLPLVTIDGKEEVFVNGCGYGVDGEVCVLVNSSAEKKKGIQYFKNAVSTLKGFNRYDLEIEIDGVRHTYKNVWFSTITNGKYFGGGMKVSPTSDRNDGVLEAIIIHSVSFPVLLFIFPFIFIGKHFWFKSVGITLLRGKTFKLAASRPLVYQTDGEVTEGVQEFSVKVE
jgi:diacylglycerol kinase family enzyme